MSRFAARPLILAAMLVIAATACAQKDLPWVFNAPRADGYSIDIVSAGPPPGSVLTAGTRVTFVVEVAYTLSITQSGMVVLVFQDERNRSAKPGEPQVAQTVMAPKGSLKLEDTVVIPEGAEELRLFIPLVPEGLSRTAGQIIIRYPITTQ